MASIQMIISVLEWERSLEFEEERRKNHRYEPYVNYLAAVQPGRKERKSIFARLFQPRKASRPVHRGCAEEPCQDVQGRSPVRL
ncbi:MAG: hypothetical protein JXB15_13930 [Anaerolineales bacterium]|nr:hypothetical protein [Anaerolineales bacterium]